MIEKVTSRADPEELSAALEGRKLLYDFFKHLTTLSTGSILLLATFLQNIFSNPEWKFLVIITFGCLILALVISVVVMVLYALTVRNPHVSDRMSLAAVIAFFAAISSFILGVISLAVFTVKNYH